MQLALLSRLYPGTRVRFRSCSWLIAVLVLLALPAAARAISCVPSSQIPDAGRNAYVQTLKSMATQVQAADVAALRARTIAVVAAQFDGMATSIQSVSPHLKGATFTVDGLYELRATDLSGGQDEAQFFCAPPASMRMVTISIPQLPPGNYLMAVLHATGVEAPQQLTFLLANDPLGTSEWKLGGFFFRPLRVGGHDSVWYWTKAREYNTRKQLWNSYFYYQTALFLAAPVNFLSSPNLEKLQKEARSVLPEQLPVTGLSAGSPLAIKVGGAVLNLTGMRTSEFAGNLDLVIDYQASNISDAVATHAQIVDLMKALLAQYPELRQAFHGLWVYAQAPGQNSYAIELPVEQIH